MKEQKLTWRARGRLWFRIGIRLVLLLAGLWLLWKVGLPLLSLLAPFVAALITAAILHPVVRWLRSTLGGSRKLWSLLVLVLLFGLMGAALGGLIYAAGAQLISLVQSWDDLLANLEGIFQQLEQILLASGTCASGSQRDGRFGVGQRAGVAEKHPARDAGGAGELCQG